MIARLVSALAALAIGVAPATAQEAVEKSLDQSINDAVGPITDFLFSIIFFPIATMGTAATDDDIPFIVAWLIVGAVAFTLYMGFINVRGFKLALKIVRGDFANPSDDGEVSHFQALTAALSGTVGLGNIAGVAVAIGLGGPGATFWMILAGFLGMSTKFVECTLGVKYRNVAPDGTTSGGPMYYLSKGLERRGLPVVGRVLAVFASVMCIGSALGGGNMFQANQALKQVVHLAGGPESFLGQNTWIAGLVLAVLVGVVIIGGIKSIARVTDKLVPLMCGLYVLSALFIIVLHFTEIPAAFAAIIEGAFAPEAVGGGIIGVMIQGIRRATFSNEAGVGSAPIAHSAVRTSEPITEGLVALLEPFIDTVVVCTMTALVIVITGTYQMQGVDGIAMTSAAFEGVISWYPILLAVAVVLFAFSTMITWSYYGLKAWTYLFGESLLMEVCYKLMFCAFVVIGAAMSLGKVIDFTDAMFFAMAFPNILGLYIMAPEVKRDLNSFLARVKTGEIRNFRENP